MKSEDTLLIEKSLIASCFAPNNKSLAKVYGCHEVRIGFDGRRMPNTKSAEYVDFMTFDKTFQVFRCYEIKVSLADLKSGNALSFYGHYNYLVVPEELYNEIKDNLSEYIPNYVGVVVWARNTKRDNSLFVMRKPKKQDLTAEQVDILKDSMIRSLFYKNYKK